MTKSELEFSPLNRPVLIDAIRCRLRQDVHDFNRPAVTIPADELKLIVDILDAARLCTKEWEPNRDEVARGHGTGVGMRAAEDRLIRAVSAE